MTETLEKMNNPIWWPGVIHGFLWSNLTISFIIIWIWYDYGEVSLDWIDILVFSSIWFIVFFGTGFGSEVFYRPKYIQIVDTGVVLYHRVSGKMEEIPWWKIMDVTIPKRKGLLESGRDGSIGISKRTRWIITKSILFQIRDKYAEKMGRTPLNLREKG